MAIAIDPDGPSGATNKPWFSARSSATANGGAAAEEGHGTAEDHPRPRDWVGTGMERLHGLCRYRHRTPIAGMLSWI